MIMCADIFLQDKYQKVLDAIKDVIADFDHLIESHEAIAPYEFNKDDIYKMYTDEAIEAKPSTLKKIDWFEEFVMSPNPPDALQLERVKKCPLKDIPVPGKKLELKTGIPPPFPWKGVEDGQSVLNFFDWDPSKFQDSQLKASLEELAVLKEIKAVVIHEQYLELKGGWNTDELSWENKVASQESQMVAGFLLKNCSSLTSLNIRCVRSDRAGCCFVKSEIFICSR